MVSLTWIRGLIAHRRGTLFAVAIGVAVTVTTLASIGTFLSATTRKMTERAISRVSVDWQVETQRGTSAAKVLAATRSFPGVKVALPVGFADATGFRANTAGSVQSTGPGFVLGLPPGYANAFPGELRTLTGSGTGVLLAQQTAANLHAKPGDTVAIGRTGQPAANVRVAGVVDLPQADSLFQKVGAPPGAPVATAPPDNVVLLPSALFAKVEGPVARTRPDLVRTQVHAKLDHHLAHSPDAAFTDVASRARNLEARLSGGGLVGDNLGSALDQARKDALYAELLFLFLGAPGAVLAGLLTATIASVGSERRRRELALLRARGASTRQLVRVSLGETLVVAAVGIAIGLGAALGIGSAQFGTASFGAGTVSAILWAAGAALAGLVVALLAVTLPAWRDARSLTVAGQRREIGRPGQNPVWQRYYLDVLALIGCGLVYYQAAQNGYNLVLAPEGVPQVSVNWYALLAPALGWIGAGLLTYRLSSLLLVRGRRPLEAAARPIAGELASTVVATMSRQRRLLARTVVLVALTAAFAGSTSVFNETYKAQAEVDARLTNGADVTVAESPNATASAADANRLAHVPGVASVEPLQHRYVYVGADLQDMYGVRPDTIPAAGKLQNAWFTGGTARDLMARLKSEPNAVLVSDETVKDFQLHPGDTLNLRLADARTKGYRPVPFHYIGVAKEFPTAPRDSFMIANQSYISKATHNPAVGTFLIQTDGTSPRTVAKRVRAVVGPTAQVTDIVDQRHVVGSNLTAVELKGLTKVELVLALVLAVAASGLALGLGFRERRRTFAIASALGASARQLGGFVWSESGFVTVGGLVLGAAIAAGLAQMLVKVLTGVFDPPPDSLSIPWGYLGAAATAVIVAVFIAGRWALRVLRRPSIEVLREL